MLEGKVEAVALRLVVVSMTGYMYNLRLKLQYLDEFLSSCSIKPYVSTYVITFQSFQYKSPFDFEVQRGVM